MLIFCVWGNQMRCQAVSVIMLPFLLSTYCSDQCDIFTCRRADGEIYLLMETPHLPIRQLCLSIHCLLWFYSRQSIGAELETSRPWRMTTLWEGNGETLLITINKVKPLRYSLRICGWGIWRHSSADQSCSHSKIPALGYVPGLISWDPGPTLWSIPVPNTALLH